MAGILENLRCEQSYYESVVSPESIANNFLEISSEQRLNIVLSLNERPWNMSSLAKKLGATVPEIHRNLGRLQNAGLVKKDGDGNYTLTSFGKIVCKQFPTFSFMLKNKKYCDTHDFGLLPDKFTQRIGALEESQIVNGYVKVIEQWKEIYKNSQKYIYNILIEIPYDQDLVRIIDDKLKSKIQIKSIFSEFAVIPKERKEVLSKFNFDKHFKDGTIERKMLRGAKIALVLNELEAGLSFPGTDGEVDMSKMLYSKNVEFHEWCFDFFKENWDSAGSFQEAKLEKN